MEDSRVIEIVKALFRAPVWLLDKSIKSQKIEPSANIGDVLQTGASKTTVWGTPPAGAPSGVAGGDLSGTYPNPTVAQVNGQLPAYYLARANHTGTQTASTISDFTAATQAIIGSFGLSADINLAIDTAYQAQRESEAGLLSLERRAELELSEKADRLHVHPATGVSFSPTGGIASANVQAALAELDTEVIHLTGDEVADGQKTFRGRLIAGSSFTLTRDLRTSDVTLSDTTSGAFQLVDTTSGSFTITLPASPSDSCIIVFADKSGKCGTNPLTIARNGNLINGAASNALLRVAYGSLALIYSIDATCWYEFAFSNLQFDSQAALAPGTALSSDVYLAFDTALEAQKLATTLDTAMQRQLDFELQEKSDRLHRHPGSEISNTPAGNIASTDVQSALNELDSEKATLASAVMDGDTAGGVLSGTYPNPGFAADMATQAELDSEASTRSSADTTLQTNITTEASTRSSADTTLQTNINTEASTRALADVSHAISSDVLLARDEAQEARKEATTLDTAMQRQLDFELQEKSDRLHRHPGSEISNTPAGNISSTDLQSAINELDSEKATLASAVMDGDTAGGVLSGTYPNPGFAADMATQAELDTESSTRSSADTTLQTNITTEASTRSSADTTLQTNINTEATTRANADVGHASTSDAFLAFDTAIEAQKLATTLDSDMNRRLDFELQEKSDRLHIHRAGDIPFTPSGNIAAADVQSAIAELDTETIHSGATAGGDLAGTLPNPTIAQNAANASDVLTWNGSAWRPAAVGTPGAHAASHAAGGSDVVTLAGAQIREIISDILLAREEANEAKRDVRDLEVAVDRKIDFELQEKADRLSVSLVSQPWRTIASACGHLQGLGAGNYVIPSSGAVDTAGNFTNMCTFAMVNADYMIGSLIPELRVIASCAINNTAPARDLNVHLIQLTASSGGAGTLSVSGVGSALMTVTFTAPAAQSLTTGISSSTVYTTANVADGVYLFRANVATGGMAGNSDANISALLQIRYRTP